MNIEERTKCYKEHRGLTGHDVRCADPGGCQFIELLLEEVKCYAKLLEKVTELRNWANRIANDERVTSWVHQEDYSLYCLLAEAPVDFDKIFEGVHNAANNTIEAAERLTTLLKEEE